MGHRVGDTVVFDTGSPDMTVTAVEGDDVTCVWLFLDNLSSPPGFSWRQEVFPGNRLVTRATV